MSQIIIGIDPSSAKVALAISVGQGKPQMRKQMLPKGEDISTVCMLAYQYIRTTVKEFRSAGHKVDVYIEEPLVGVGGVYSTIRQARVNGAILAAAAGAGARVHTVNVQSWKKAVCGNGRMNKAQVKAWLRESWTYAYDLCAGDQDLMDATCILAYGQKAVSVRDKIERHADYMDTAQTKRRTSTRR